MEPAHEHDLLHSSSIAAQLPHAISPDQVDNANDQTITVPFHIEEETFPVPARCDDEADLSAPFAGLWMPGRPLTVAYVTWNMAQMTPNMEEVADFGVRPNAHIIIVTTQENGPYVGLNTQHHAWERLIEDVCLQQKYVKLCTHSLWAIHLGVYARRRDVAYYVREVHVGVHKTGAVGGTMGNKGGIGVGLTLSLRQSTMMKALAAFGMAAAAGSGRANEPQSDEVATLATNGVDARQQSPAPPPPPGSISAQYSAATVGEEGETNLLNLLKTAKADGVHPRELTMLFIGTHLTAHQGNVDARNQDYLNIVRELPIGSRGIYRSKFLDALSAGAVRGGSSSSAASPAGGGGESVLRDSTNEFDVCFFGGDLNYRLNGTRRAIEFIVKHRKSLRSVLIHNDQLLAEIKRGVVFHEFVEGQLHFRPTYKYHMEKNKVTTDDYDFNPKKPRMPAYCDRILWKKRSATMQPFFPMQQTLYTDCPGVRSSDHRPVVGMWRIETTLVLDGASGDDTPAAPDPQFVCCDGCL